MTASFLVRLLSFFLTLGINFPGMAYPVTFAVPEAVLALT